MSKLDYKPTLYPLAFSFKTLMLLVWLLPTSLCSKVLQNSPQEVCIEKSSLITTYTFSFHNSNAIEIYVAEDAILHLGDTPTTLISTKTQKKSRKKTGDLAQNNHENATNAKAKDQAFTFTPLPPPHKSNAISSSNGVAVLIPQTHKIKKQPVGKALNTLGANRAKPLGNKPTLNLYTRTTRCIVQHFCRYDYALPPPCLLKQTQVLGVLYPC